MPPIKLRITRKDYKRMSVDDLGLNIVGNGSKIFANSANAIENSPKHYHDRVKLTIKLSSGSDNGLEITDEKTDVFIPFIGPGGRPFQPTIRVYSKIVEGANLDFQEVNSKVSLRKPVTIFAKDQDWDQAKRTARDFGRINSSAAGVDFLDIDLDLSFYLFLMDIVHGV